MCVFCNERLKINCFHDMCIKCLEEEKIKVNENYEQGEIETKKIALVKSITRVFEYPEEFKELID